MPVLRLLHDPADVLRRALVAAGQGTMPSDGAAWPFHHPAEPSDPDDVVTVRGTAGIGQGSDSPDLVAVEMYGIQVTVRCRRPDDGAAKSYAVADAMDKLIRAAVVVGSATYRVHAVNRGSVIPLGKEPTSNRNKYTINATMSLTREV